jgi:ABC-type branched-subunit amino acid transport system substrate-binding protein
VVRRVAVCGLAALGLAVVGCGGDDSGGAASSGGGGEDTITIGGLAPESGLNQEAGEPQKIGMQMAVDDYNKEGVEVGGKKYKIALNEADSGSDNTTIVAATTKMVRDQGVKYLIGPVNATLESPGIAPVAQKNGALMVAMYPQQIIGGQAKDFPNIFNVKPDTPSAASGFAAGVPQLWPDTKRVYILMENSAGGHAQVEIGYKPYLESKGMDVEVTFYNKGSTKDFTGFLTKAKAFKPDVLMYGYEYAASLAILKQALQLDVADKYFDMTGACCDAALKDATGSPIDKPAGFLASPKSLTYPTNDTIQAFADDMQTKINRPFEQKDSVAMTGYYMVQLIVEAMKASGSTDVEKISETMKSGEFDTILGKVSFTPEQNAKTITEAVCVVDPGSDPRCEDLPLPPADFKAK